MNEELIIKELTEKINNTKSLKEINDLKVEYLGKKGIITELQSKIKEISNEEKKEYGIKLNKIRTSFNTLYEEKLNILNLEEINKKLESEKIDITLPSKRI